MQAELDQQFMQQALEQGLAIGLAQTPEPSAPQREKADFHEVGQADLLGHHLDLDVLLLQAHFLGVADHAANA